jgi:hypothetical protein
MAPRGRMRDEEALMAGYSAMVARMDKLDLLEEMVRFQEERSRVGALDDEMVARGLVLFRALSECSETRELGLLCRSYLRHLECEALARREKA